MMFLLPALNDQIKMMHYSNECLCSHFRYVEFIPFVACVTFHQILMGVPGPSPYFQELHSSHYKLAGYILNSNATISAPWNYLEIVYHLWFIRYVKKMVISSRAGRNTKIPFYLLSRSVHRIPNFTNPEYFVCYIREKKNTFQHLKFRKLKFGICKIGV